MCLSSVTQLNYLCYASGMTTITNMRREITIAHQSGFNKQMRTMSGIDGAPKDATEVFILYLALEALRNPSGWERQKAFDACEALKKWNGG